MFLLIRSYLCSAILPDLFVSFAAVMYTITVDNTDRFTIWIPIETPIHTHRFNSPSNDVSADSLVFMLRILVVDCVGMSLYKLDCVAYIGGAYIVVDHHALPMDSETQSATYQTNLEHIKLDCVNADCMEKNCKEEEPKKEEPPTTCHQHKTCHQMQKPYRKKMSSERKSDRRRP
eukprot:211828_1